MKPLQLDDGRGVEDLHLGLLQERVTGLPCGEVTPRRGSLQVTCLEAWSSLARTKLLSSVEEVEDFSPYPPANLENYLYLINVPSSYQGLLNIQG